MNHLAQCLAYKKYSSSVNHYFYCPFCLFQLEKQNGSLLCPGTLVVYYRGGKLIQTVSLQSEICISDCFRRTWGITCDWLSLWLVDWLIKPTQKHDRQLINLVVLNRSVGRLICQCFIGLIGSYRNWLVTKQLELSWEVGDASLSRVVTMGIEMKEWIVDGG